MLVMPVDRFLSITVLALALLFAALEPPPSRSLAFPAALAFWLLHIGLGMALAVLASQGLARVAGIGRMNPWARLALAGVIGSLLFAPAALAIDLALAEHLTEEPPKTWLAQWEADGGARALLAEWLQLAPSYLASWLLVNAIPLSGAAAAGASREQPSIAATLTQGPAGQSAAQPSAAMSLRELPAAQATQGAPDEPGSASETEHARRTAFLAQLPPAIGHNLVAIQVDLHYLQVRTTRGRATVLASIAAAEHALGADGLRVHRSHWVAVRHVQRVLRTARGMYLNLSDGSRVPVSRRRVGLVLERLGRDFVLATD